MSKMQLSRGVREEALSEIFEKISQANLARELTARGYKCNRSAVNQWRVVPLEAVRLVSEITGRPLKVIRSDGRYLVEGTRPSQEAAPPAPAG